MQSYRVIDQFSDKKRGFSLIDESVCDSMAALDAELDEDDFIGSIIKSSALPPLSVTTPSSALPSPARIHRAVKLTMKSEAGAASWSLVVRDVSVRITDVNRLGSIQFGVVDSTSSGVTSVSACPAGQSASKRRKCTSVEMVIPFGDISTAVFTTQRTRSVCFTSCTEPDNLIAFLRAANVSDSVMAGVDDAFSGPVEFRIDMHHDNLLQFKAEWESVPALVSAVQTDEAKVPDCLTEVGSRNAQVPVSELAVECEMPVSKFAADLPVVDRSLDIKRPVSSGRRYALVIGVSKFTCPKIADLRFAAQDAQRMSDCLTKLGYDVTLLNDEQEDFLLPTFSNVLAELKRILSLAKPADTVLVYMATHGLRLPVVGGPVLLFTDTRFENLADGSGTLPLSQLESLLDKHTAASRRLLFLDCCHQGLETGRGLPDELDGEPKEPALDLFEMQQHFELGEGLGCLYASSAHQMAAETKDSGLFTRFLLDAMDQVDGPAGATGRADVNGKGFVSFGDLVRFVTPALKRFCMEKRLRPQDPTWQFRGFGDVIVADFRPDIAI